MATNPSPAESRVFGPEYGPEAIRRLRAGFQISYTSDGMLIRETPEGRRFEIRIEADGSATFLREL